MKNTKRFIFRFAIVFLFLGLSGCDGCTDKLKKNDQKVTFDDVEDIIITDIQARTRFENYGEHRSRIIKIYENNDRRFTDSILQKQELNKREEKEMQTVEQSAKKGFVPVQYTYYDFEKFKKYLKYVEQETEKAGADISTIRIYFANYPEDDKDNDKRRRNTVMFVPTININGNESAYYISDEGKDGVYTPFLLTDSLERTSKAAPESSLNRSNVTNEASLFPNVINSPYFALKSVIGNEGGRNPPAAN